MKCNIVISLFLFCVTQVAYGDYTKICNNGKLAGEGSCPTNPVLGSASNDWACTKDNKTGLIWEVKTKDNGLRDMAKKYSNYTVDYPKCDNATSLFGGEEGACKKYGYNGSLTDSTNTDGFILAVNSQGLCGKNDWRLPTNEELKSLIYCSDGKYNTVDNSKFGFICKSNDGWKLNVTPTINTIYFPDINNDNLWFWSSSSTDSVSGAWDVSFGHGVSSFGGYRGNYEAIRLVHEDQPLVYIQMSPILSLSGTPATTAYVNKNYSVTLKAVDVDNPSSNTVIAIDWGDGTSASQGGVTSDKSVSISHIYKNAGTYTWVAVAHSANGLKSQDLVGTVQVSNEQVSSLYTKVCNNGKLAGEGSCPIDPVLGSASNDWACTKDNKTGLIWEVKTESGLHDMYNRYTWYDPWYIPSFSSNKNNGKKNGGSCTGSQCDTYAYTKAVNNENFCGEKNWRVPTISELQSLIKNSGVEPSIDTVFFPNTYSFFWSSTTPTDNKSNAWGTYFYEEGYSNFSAKSGVAAVRLVSGQAKSAGKDPTDDKKAAFGLVADKDLMWAKGQQIRVRFVNGSFNNQKIVFDKIKEWETVAKANLKIVWVTKNKFGGNAAADVRIRIPGAGNSDKGSHSFIGIVSQTRGFSPDGVALDETQISQPCDLKLYGNDCFGYSRMMISDYPSISYVNMNMGDFLHEFGHALGFDHEHISPSMVIPWVDNEQTVLDYFKLSQKWDDEKTKWNVFGKTKKDPKCEKNCEYVKQEICDSCYSPSDVNSVMMYPIPNFYCTTKDKNETVIKGTDEKDCPIESERIYLTKNRFSTQKAQVLSLIDKEWARKFYPFPPPAVAKPQPVATGFYRATDKPEVYRVNAETKTFCHVASPEDMNQLGGFSQVQTTSDESFKYGLGNNGFCQVWYQNGSCNLFKVIFGGCK